MLEVSKLRWLTVWSGRFDSARAQTSASKRDQSLEPEQQLNHRDRVPRGKGGRVYSGHARETPGGFALRVRQRRVLELFDKAGGKVLDVGCGPAEVVQPLLSLGCQFWGVDPSPKRPNPKWTNRWPWRFSISQFRWERYQLVF